MVEKEILEIKNLAFFKIYFLEKNKYFGLEVPTLPYAYGM